MHNFLVNVALLLHAHRHTRHQVMAVALGLDALHVLQNSLVGVRTAATIRDFGATVDRTQNRVHLHQIVVLDRFEECRVCLDIDEDTTTKYLQTETSIREHVHNLVNYACFQQRLSTIEANRQILNLSFHYFTIPILT